MDDALRELNRAEHAIAIAAHIESQWAAMLADNRYLENRSDDLGRCRLHKLWRTLMTNELKTMLRAELSAIDAQAETLATRKSAILVLLDKPANVETKPVDVKPVAKPIVGSTAKEVAAKLAAARSPAAQSVRKGRGQGRRANLSEADIAAIRERAANSGKSFEWVGAHFNISRSTVANIVNRKGRFA